MPIKYKNLNIMMMMSKRRRQLTGMMQLLKLPVKNELVLVSKQKYMVPYKKPKYEIILYNPTGL
jgi:hypothetical protein